MRRSASTGPDCGTNLNALRLIGAIGLLGFSELVPIRAIRVKGLDEKTESQANFRRERLFPVDRASLPGGSAALVGCTNEAA
jgi:hypothetical protein